MNVAISIIIPIYNEEGLLKKLFNLVQQALSKITENYEVILVNDGSIDDSENIMLELHELDPRFKVLSLSRNFGHQAAVWAGLTNSSGDCVGIMDGDLQDPPELFEEFYGKIIEGFDVVYAIRRKRKEGLLKKIAYRLFYKILSYSSKVMIPIDSGDFSLFTRKVALEMLKLKERNPFVRGIRSWVGFQQYGFEYERDSRDSGEVKYTFKKLFRLAADGFFGFSDFPIRFLGRLGLVIIFGSIGYAAYIIFKLLFLGTVPEGFTTIILTILFFGGVQLFSIRVIGEYVLRIFDETRERPIFIVKSFTK